MAEFTQSRRRRLKYYYSRRLHPEALDWLARVKSAGSGASATTVQAVSDFCERIDAAGIRSRFVRLNLFAGNNLTAALVPLYRGTALGALVGNATDTNTNFVGADYVETGASGGLVGNGSTKNLATGITTNILGSNRHASGIITSYSDTSFRYFLGSLSAANTNAFGLLVRDLSVRYYNSTGIFFSGAPTLASSGIFLGTSVADDHSVSANGGSFGSYSAAAAVANDVSILIFAASQAGTPINFNASRMGGYSLGLDLTQAGATSYAQAAKAFATALSRPTF
jgi:hypothetical protein